MLIAMIGTRGVPAQYGGFEAAVEEIGQRLVRLGHEVRVYCRNPKQTTDEYLGMSLINLPAIRLRATETLTHTSLSVGHALRFPPDVAIVFNAANACLVPALKARGIPVAIHVDGLESRRAKWGRVGRNYYLLSERLAVRLADVLIADAEGIRDHYRETYGADPAFLPYGMPLPAPEPRLRRLSEIGVEPGKYHLVVARLEPENHVLEAVEARGLSSAVHPLVVVGAAPYADAYRARIASAVGEDVRLVGSIYDQELLTALYAGAVTYVHGHSVGGTNPSLLRALAAGTPILAHDNVFNREVAGKAGAYWADPRELATQLASTELQPIEARERCTRHRDVVAGKYSWDAVTAGYEAQLLRLAGPRAQR